MIAHIHVGGKKIPLEGSFAQCNLIHIPYLETLSMLLLLCATLHFVIAWFHGDRRLFVGVALEPRPRLGGGDSRSSCPYLCPPAMIPGSQPGLDGYWNRPHTSL
jgi:hypothetical protein